MLHIGAMKTGTTYLQNLLDSNRGVLEERGWQVPPFPFVTTGTREILGLTKRSEKSGTPTWDRLTHQLESWPGIGSLVSMEFLSYARQEPAQRIVRSLAGTDLTVVLTVRDAAGALPSQWQSYSRNKGKVPWGDFVHDVATARADHPSPSSRTFNRTQNIPRMLRVWGEILPRDRLLVVTVPPSSSPRDLLWQRFCQAADVDPDGTLVPDDAFGNPGLGYGSIDLLRRLNAAGLADLDDVPYRAIARYLARNHLVPLRGEESRPRLDRSGAKFAARLNRRTRGSIKKYARLVGSLDDLPTRVRKDGLDPGGRPVDVPESEVRRSAQVARAAIVDLLSERGLAADPADLEPSDDLDTAVGRLARLMRMAAESPPGA